MHPPRNRDQRQNDITALLGFDRMNVVLPRNRSAVEDAAAALAKWRLFSRHCVDVSGLAMALESAGWPAWADEVRARWGEDNEAPIMDLEDEEEDIGSIAEDDSLADLENFQS